MPIKTLVGKWRGGPAGEASIMTISGERNPFFRSVFVIVKQRLPRYGVMSLVSSIGCGHMS